MKGPVSAPACGFSEQAVKILNDGCVPFTPIDVLAAPVLREAVKALGDFPTYPQLWLRGELVGGVDALLELTARVGGGVGALALEFKLAPTKPVEPLEDRLRRLVAAAPAVLFLKGAPGAPRCGFSASALSLLDEVGVVTHAAVPASSAAVGGGARFATFDILADQTVREGLKALFAWPTYPQLYVKGMLVGGLDVMREMHEEGELASTLRDAGAIGEVGERGGHSHDGVACAGEH
jgi:glutaredoxin-related protein